MKIKLTNSYLFLLVLLTSCSHAQSKPNAEAVKLNILAARLGYDSVMRNPDSIYQHQILRKAISLLNKAIVLDSNYYLAYSNKFSFQQQLKLNDSAIITGKQMIKLRPKFLDLNMWVGGIYEKQGDRVHAFIYYKTALDLFNKTLETLDKASPDYVQTEINKGMALLLLDQPTNAQAVFKNINDTTTNENLKHITQQLMGLNKHDVLYGHNGGVTRTNAITK